MQSFFMGTTKARMTAGMRQADSSLRWAHVLEGSFSHIANATLRHKLTNEIVSRDQSD